MSYGHSTFNSFLFENNFSKISRYYESFIIDLWGVVHNGINLFPHVKEVLFNLKKLGKKIIFLSNSPQLKLLVYKQLKNIGLTLDVFDNVITSGEITTKYLEKKINYLGPHGYFLGQSIHKYTFNKIKGLLEVNDINKANFIFNSGPVDLNQNLASYRKILEHSVRKQLIMFCINPDVKVNFVKNKILCAGFLAKRYEEMGGIVYYYGKPYKEVYREVFKYLDNKSIDNMLVLGDSLQNDVQGALNIKVDSVFFLTGVHSRHIENLKLLGNFQQEEVLNVFFQEYRFAPTYIMPSLRW